MPLDPVASVLAVVAAITAVLWPAVTARRLARHKEKQEAIHMAATRLNALEAMVAKMSHKPLPPKPPADWDQPEFEGPLQPGQ